jgi:hypothetical protein
MRVAVRQFPHRAPTADVRPADVGRDQRRLLGFLHDRVIDRLLRRLFEGGRVEHQKAQIRRRRLDRRLGRRENLRFEFGDFGLHHIGAENEIAAVPIIAGVDVALRGGAVRLFDEGFELQHVAARRQRPPARR